MMLQLQFVDERRELIRTAVDAPTVTIKGKGDVGIDQTFKITGDRHFVDFLDILLQAKVKLQLYRPFSHLPP